MKAGGNERNEIRRSNSRPEMANLSLHQLDKYPRDLLQRFMSTETARQQQAQKRDKEIESQDDIELNLGLSLGGRFGVDKNDKKLIRSSSVAASIPIFRDDDSNTPAPPQPYPSLVRTSSLPTETEEEWRKRKELQMLRRMEAKRRRSEKQKSSRERNEGSLSLEEEKQQQLSSKGNLAVVGPPLGLPTWLTAARQASGGPGGGNGGGDGGATQGLQVRPSSQGSGESSSISEPQQGSSSCGETRSSCSPQSLQEPIKQEVVGSPGTKAVENPSRTPGSLQGRRMNSMEEMPCVFTKGDGPNGRRVEGILYRCGKREEVRIMCVCHGIFHSPAEFVKHAGGGDVDNPLRHIVVNTSSSASFS